MVLVVHDLEMRGSKLHLIHNYKDLKGGGLRRREHIKSRENVSEYETNKILNKPKA